MSREHWQIVTVANLVGNALIYLMYVTMEGMKGVAGVLSRRLESRVYSQRPAGPKNKTRWKAAPGEPAGRRGTSCAKAGSLYYSYFQKWARYFSECLASAPAVEYRLIIAVKQNNHKQPRWMFWYVPVRSA